MRQQKTAAARKRALHRRSVPAKIMGGRAVGRTPRPKVPRIDPRVRDRKVAVARAAGRRRMYVVGSLFASVGLIVGAVVLLHSSLFSAKTIAIEGAKHTSASEVLVASGLVRHPALIDVNPGAVASAIERLPWVKTATVSRSFPTTVHVHIIERIAVADVSIGKAGFALLDVTGRVLSLVNAPSRAVVTASGVGVVPTPGRFLSRTADPIVEVAGATPVSLISRIASVGRIPTTGIVLLVRKGPTVILGTATDLRQKMVSLATVLARMDLSGIVTIDLRVPADPVLTK